jgi:hypothetical protein
VKAIVYYEYGPPDVLRCEDVERAIPGDAEVSVKVRAASLNPYDWHFMRGEPYAIRLMAGLGKPKNNTSAPTLLALLTRPAETLLNSSPATRFTGFVRAHLLNLPAPPKQNW